MLLHQPEKPLLREETKRKFRFSLIASLGIFCTLVLVVFLMAVFFLPTIQALEGTNLNGQTEILSVIASSVGKNYSIQISAYPETKINEATEFVSELRKRLPDVHMEKVYIQGQGVWNRILVGHFATFEEASLYMKEKKLFDVFPGSFVKLTSEG
jgi:hypothetical protein